MALNIKPFEGPRAPDWTDPVVFKEELVATTASASHQEGRGQSEAFLLFEKSRRKFIDQQGSLKKLDIL
jgi:hypothetical protein